MDWEVSNMTFNSTDTKQKYYLDFYDKLFTEVSTIIGLISIVTNILTIFIIFRFKKLRREVTNIIIAHLNLMEVAFFMTSPQNVKMATILELFTKMPSKLICALFESTYVVVDGVGLLLVLLICDWYIKFYCESKYDTFCRVYRFFILAIYVCVVIFCAITTQFCLRKLWSFVLSLTTFAGYAFLLVCLIGINIVHLVKKKTLRENKSNVGLILVNTFFILWCPAIVTVIIIIINNRVHGAVFVTAFSLGFSSPIVSFIYLFYYVDSFNTFFNKIFNCQCSDNENEVLEERSVSFNDMNGVQINR